MDFEEILAVEKEVMDAYGFSKQQINFLLTKKPKFLAFHREDDTGLKVVETFLVDELNLPMSQL